VNELRRLAYLDALGIDAYVSRSQLPGAAQTRRLAIVPAVPPVEVGDVPGPVGEGAQATSGLAGLDSPGAAQLPQIDTAPDTPAPVPATATPRLQAAVPRFSLAAIVAGGCLWLEELHGMPLAREQVQLVQAMAQALGVMAADTDKAAPEADLPGAARPGAARPEVTQFDWPIHTNQQLDIGEEAARASVAGFIGRKLEQRQCRGLVLLGQPCRARVPLDQLEVLTVHTASSAELLADPRLKKQAWRDLLSLVRC